MRNGWPAKAGSKGFSRSTDAVMAAAPTTTNETAKLHRSLMGDLPTVPRSWEEYHVGGQVRGPDGLHPRGGTWMMVCIARLPTSGEQCPRVRVGGFLLLCFLGCFSVVLVFLLVFL